jgi:hypothetical protein
MSESKPIKTNSFFMKIFYKLRYYINDIIEGYKYKKELQKELEKDKFANDDEWPDGKTHFRFTELIKREDE